MLGLLLITLSFAVFSTATLFVLEPSHQKYLWNSFKRDFNKNYGTAEEEEKRFLIFLENLKLADQRNEDERKAGGSAVHGITMFSDISQEEFQSIYLTANPEMKSKDRNEVKIDSEPDSTLGLIDWTGVYTTPVKNQGYCGSCWAFSATEQIESDAMRELRQSYILSPGQITQCTTGCGCGGGWTEAAYVYVKDAGGLSTSADYPYTSYVGLTGQCEDKKRDHVVSVRVFNTLTGEKSMASYVQQTGPLSVCLSATLWNTYAGGVMTQCGYSVDHCVQAVGVDASDDGFWKVRNSWGTAWGESGFIRLAYGANTCHINNDPTYVAVEKV